MPIGPPEDRRVSRELALFRGEADISANETDVFPDVQFPPGVPEVCGGRRRRSTARQCACVSGFMPIRSAIDVKSRINDLCQASTYPVSHAYRTDQVRRGFTFFISLCR